MVVTLLICLFMSCDGDLLFFSFSLLFFLFFFSSPLSFLLRLLPQRSSFVLSKLALETRQKPGYMQARENVNRGAESA